MRLGLTARTRLAAACTIVHGHVTQAIIDALQAVTGEQKGKAVCRGLRLKHQLMERVLKATKDGGFANPSAFIRAAVERELAGRESGVDSAEERIAASLDRLAREIRGIKLGQQAQFAFTDTLVKTILTCLSEPPKDVYDQAVSRGRLRYNRFLKSVGAGMSGDSQAAMAELVKRGEED